MTFVHLAIPMTQFASTSEIRASTIRKIIGCIKLIDIHEINSLALNWNTGVQTKTWKLQGRGLHFVQSTHGAISPGSQLLPFLAAALIFWLLFRSHTEYNGSQVVFLANLSEISKN